jgi:hypothetical protein
MLFHAVNFVIYVIESGNQPLGFLIGDNVRRQTCAAGMPKHRTSFEPYGWYTGELLGQKLRERYESPKGLPPNLLSLVRKLGAVEGKRLLRRMQQARLEPEWPNRARV